MMNGISNTAAAFQAVMLRAERAARGVGEVASGGIEHEPAEAMAELLEAEAEFKAAIEIVRAQDETLGVLLDIKA
ncbi:MAG: hypothetical protein AB7O04_04215 [Hyphomonadaceae bacterium]